MSNISEILNPENSMDLQKYLTSSKLTIMACSIFDCGIYFPVIFELRSSSMAVCWLNFSSRLEWMISVSVIGIIIA